MKTINCYFPELCYDPQPGHADVMQLVAMQNQLTRARWNGDLVEAHRLQLQLDERVQSDKFNRCFPADTVLQ